MRRWYCADCKIDSDIGFCQNCGQQLQPLDPETAPSHSRSRRSIIMGIGVGAAIVAGVIVVGLRLIPILGPVTETPTLQPTSIPAATPTTAAQGEPTAGIESPTTLQPTASPTSVPASPTLFAATATAQEILTNGTPTSTPTAPPTATARNTATSPPQPVERTFGARVNRTFSLEGSQGIRESCIIGRVIDRNGRGIQGAVLYANNGVANTSTVTTNDRGEYSICKLGLSPWSIALTFVPPPDLRAQVIATVPLNGNPDQIASVDFVER